MLQPRKVAPSKERFHFGSCSTFQNLSLQHCQNARFIATQCGKTLAWQFHGLSSILLRSEEKTWWSRLILSQNIDRSSSMQIILKTLSLLPNFLS